jgi:16S rRNA G527 N7-methylase RsmG
VPPPDLLKRLQALAQAIAPAAARLGLTNYATADEYLHHAMLPAFALLVALPDGPSGEWAEIGAGSGGLGITLAAAAPTATVHLIDRRERVAAFLDLIIARADLPNVRAIQADLPLRSEPERVYDGIVFRAFPPAARGLRIAARHARSWVAAWHSPDVAAYDDPPPSLSLVARAPTASEGLLMSLFRRVDTLGCR